MNIPNMDEIADVIIRPARHQYKMADLGSKCFTMDECSILRSDFEVKNNRGLIIKCSYYSKQSVDKNENVLIYLHCNSGCRLEGTFYQTKG